MHGPGDAIRGFDPPPWAHASRVKGISDHAVTAGEGWNGDPASSAGRRRAKQVPDIGPPGSTAVRQRAKQVPGIGFPGSTAVRQRAKPVPGIPTPVIPGVRGGNHGSRRACAPRRPATAAPREERDLLASAIGGRVAPASLLADIDRLARSDRLLPARCRRHEGGRPRGASILAGIRPCRQGCRRYRRTRSARVGHREPIGYGHGHGRGRGTARRPPQAPSFA